MEQQINASNWWTLNFEKIVCFASLWNLFKINETKCHNKNINDTKNGDYKRGLLRGLQIKFYLFYSLI